MSIDQLIPSDYNPRVELKPGDAEFESLRRSIDTFGFVEPVVWNERSGHVVGGHQRINVAKHLEYTQLDVVVVDLDDQSEKTLNIALNKISGEWDIPKLRDLLEELDTGEVDIELTGFSQAEFEELMTSVALDAMDQVHDDGFDPDAAVSDIKNPVTQLGDIWHLGRHQLLCGDSTRREDILRLMGDHKAHMIFTDPPYNVNYKSDDGKAIANDNMESAQFQQFLKAAFQHAYEITEEGAPFTLPTLIRREAISGRPCVKLNGCTNKRSSGSRTHLSSAAKIIIGSLSLSCTRGSQEQRIDGTVGARNARY